MKKKVLSFMLGICMLGTALTGCGGEDTTVTKTDENTVVIKASTEEEIVESTEAAEPENESSAEELPLTDETGTSAEELPLADESETSAEELPLVDETESSAEELPLADETETEVEEAGDYLSENGIVITPQSEVTSIEACISGTDDVVVQSASVTVTTTPSDEEGYSDTTAKFYIAAIDGVASNFAFHAFDRYTGVDYESCFEDGGASFAAGETGTVYGDAFVFDVDGTQYRCSRMAGQETLDGGDVIFTISVHHPSEYDGVVFSCGKYGVTMREFNDTIDDSQPYLIMDYPQQVEGYVFVTATDK